MKGVIAFVALSPMRYAHCVISGEIPIPANTGTKMNDINAHFDVEETIMRLIRAVNKINNISIHKLSERTEESIFAPIIAIHLSRCEYSKQANIWAAKKAITK